MFLMMQLNFFEWIDVSIRVVLCLLIDNIIPWLQVFVTSKDYRTDYRSNHKSRIAAHAYAA